MNQQRVYHPFLFALFPALFLYAHNAAEHPLGAVVWPAVVSLLAAGLAWAAAYRWLRDPQKAGLGVTLAAGVFFSYGHALTWFESFAPDAARHRYALPVASAFAAVVLWAVWRTRRDLRPVTAWLNAVAVVLVAWQVFSIGHFHWKQSFSRADVARGAASAPPPPATQGYAATPMPPDIYYIVPDRYAGPRTLEKLGHDNESFYAFLRSRGFFIATESRANYPQTWLSLGSSLNMDYLGEASGLDANRERLKDHAVGRFLKARGYRYIHMGSWWNATRKNPAADLHLHYKPPMGEFAIHFLKTTMLYPFLIERHWDVHRAWTLYTLERLETVPSMPGPKFVFVHLLIPHNPFVFDEDGSRPSLRQVRQRSAAESYLRQLRFTNRQLERAVDTILSRSPSPPVIVLQSDEGPFLSEEFGGLQPARNLDWSRLSPEAVFTHMEILNAYLLPGLDHAGLSASLSPVNSFRLIFNHYFGASFPLLEERHYIYEGRADSLVFRDMTDVLTDAAPPSIPLPQN